MWLILKIVFVLFSFEREREKKKEETQQCLIVDIPREIQKKASKKTDEVGRSILFSPCLSLFLHC
jgi:hypothetical protein